VVNSKVLESYQLTLRTVNSTTQPLLGKGRGVSTTGLAALPLS